MQTSSAAVSPLDGSARGDKDVVLSSVSVLVDGIDNTEEAVVVLSTTLGGTWSCICVITEQSGVSTFSSASGWAGGCRPVVVPAVQAGEWTQNQGYLIVYWPSSVLLCMT